MAKSQKTKSPFYLIPYALKDGTPNFEKATRIEAATKEDAEAQAVQLELNELNHGGDVRHISEEMQACAISNDLSRHAADLRKLLLQLYYVVVIEAAPAEAKVWKLLAGKIGMEQ